MVNFKYLVKKKNEIFYGYFFYYLKIDVDVILNFKVNF